MQTDGPCDPDSVIKILFVTPEIPSRLTEGGQIRLWNTLQAVQRCGTVDVMVFQNLSRSPDEDVYANCRQVFAVSQDWLQFTMMQRHAYESSWGRAWLTMRTMKPFRYQGPSNRSLRRWFTRLVDDERYDVIWISKAVSAVTLGWRDPVRTILDGDNFDYVLNYHLLTSSLWYGAKVCNYVDLLKLAFWERQLHRWFARVVRCSEHDRRRCRARNIVVIPNGTKIPESVVRLPARRILFVGSLGYEPNRLGVEWFLKRIWPAIRRAVPDAEFDVAGSQPSGDLISLNNHDGIRVHGFVEDLQPLWRRASLSVAPLLAGAGTRLKIPESLAHGVPVVSTTIGAFGLELGSADGVVRADDPGTFASVCVELLCDQESALALGDRGRLTASARYNWEDIRHQIQHLVCEVASSSASPRTLPPLRV